jgi:methyltransferase (TIGR00027 family)
MTPVGATSRWVAANRALETESPAPLYVDPYARELAGEAGFQMMSAMRPAQDTTISPGPEPYLSIRTKFLDDAMLRAARDSSIGQAVILAAGMDARAFRLDWPRGLVLFEVDRDEVFDHKEAVLLRLKAKPRCDRRIVRTDLAGDWTAAIVKTGFEPRRPSLFLIEGLLMYLDEGAVSRLLTSVGALAREESWIGLDVMSREMLTLPFMAAYLKKLADRGCPWKFGISDPETFLAQYGWRGKIVTPGEPEASYGRWPYPVVPRSVSGIPRSYLVDARRVASR